MELWYPIIGYEGLYEVSNYGVIRSLERSVSGGRWGKIYKRKRKVLARTLDLHGFYRVSLRKDGKNKKFYIGKLVAESFIPNPENKKQIRYKNGNKRDNRWTNIYRI